MSEFGSNNGRAAAIATTSKSATVTKVTEGMVIKRGLPVHFPLTVLDLELTHATWQV